MSAHIKQAYTAAFLQVAIIGFSFLFVKIALQTIAPLELLTLRFLVAALVVITTMMFQGLPRHLSRGDVLRMLPLASLYPVLFFGFQAYGLLYATTTEGGIVSAMAPVFTVLLASALLKEKTNTVQRVMILVSVLGLVYLTVVNSGSVPAFSINGTVLLLLSVAALSLYTVLVRKVTQVYSFKDITSVILVAGALFFLTVSLIAHRGPGGLVQTAAHLTDQPVLASVLYLGILSSYVSSLLNNYALMHLEVTKVAVLSNFSPVLATLAGVVLLGEPFTLQHVAGMTVVLLGVIGVNRFGRG